MAQLIGLLWVIHAAACRELQGELLPVCVYFHGGCWFMGRLDGKDAWLRRLSNLAGIIIMSVDYRCACLLALITNSMYQSAAAAECCWLFLSLD